MSGLGYLDHILHRLLIRSKFFAKGWGDYEQLRRLQQVQASTFRVREKPSQDLFEATQLTSLTLSKPFIKNGMTLVNGSFLSPFEELVYPGLLPVESRTAYFQLVLPANRDQAPNGFALHFAGTGDHNFWRRRELSCKPLLEQHNIASIILQNPYYGLRKPPDQFSSSLRYVLDLFAMGSAMIAEAFTLLQWGQKQQMGTPCVTGFSLGGHVAGIHQLQPLQLLSSLAFLLVRAPVFVLTSAHLSSVFIYLNGPFTFVFGWVK